MASFPIPQAKLPTFEGFTHLTEDVVKTYVMERAELAAVLGGSPADWSAKEIGDGNLNFVYLIRGPKGGLCVKQALPFLRVLGEEWPLSQTRAFFEGEYGRIASSVVPLHVPQLHLLDGPNAIIAMQLLSPHIILRKGFIAGKEYPLLADHISTYLARMLFFTSDLALSSTVKRQLNAVWSQSTELPKLTEDVVFTEPYIDDPKNRWTPALDDAVLQLKANVALKAKAAVFKNKFLTSAQSLIHGDLHTGSVMVTDTETFVIDGEFSMYGPMGFDIGAYLANVFLAFFAHPGHQAAPTACLNYQEWLLQHVREVWSGFETKFLALWADRETALGDAYPKRMFEGYSAAGGEEAAHQARQAYLGEVFSDTLGFLAIKMIRRLVGVAHVEDMESISDVDMRARCERKALDFAVSILGRATELKDMATVTASAWESGSSGASSGK